AAADAPVVVVVSAVAVVGRHSRHPEPAQSDALEAHLHVADDPGKGGALEQQALEDVLAQRLGDAHPADARAGEYAGSAACREEIDGPVVLVCGRDLDTADLGGDRDRDARGRVAKAMCAVSVEG